MMFKYDLHNHIMPGIDDGARNVEGSLKLLEAHSLQGIRNICLTPHYYSYEESIDSFLERRRNSIDELLPSIPTDMNIKFGAEVFATKYLFTQDHDLSDLCVSGTKFMLTEFPYSSTFRSGSLDIIIRLTSLGIIPILAHVERYEHLMRNLSILEELISMGVVVQSNAVSFTERSTRRKLLKMLEQGYINIISSDAHSLRRNPPETMTEAAKIISKKLSPDIIGILNENAAGIFGE